MLADVSPAAGSDLMSLGSTGISVSEGPLWGGTGRSASDRSALGFTLELRSPSLTMQSSCSLEASPNTLVSSGRGTEMFNTRGSNGVHNKHDKSRGDGKQLNLTSTSYRFKNVDGISKLTDFNLTYHDQHLGYQSPTAWTSSVQQLVITERQRGPTQ